MYKICPVTFTTIHTVFRTQLKYTQGKHVVTFIFSLQSSLQIETRCGEHAAEARTGKNCDTILKMKYKNRKPITVLLKSEKFYWILQNAK